MALLSVDDARARVLSGVTALGPEEVAIADAFGRSLAHDMTARLTQPPFDASAMDGYAVRSVDASTGARLAVIGAAQAGRGFAGPVLSGQAVRIFTGAPLPAGADTVIIQENVHRDGDTITIETAASIGANIRRAGIDFTAGARVLCAGRRLDAHALSLLAAMGLGVVPVVRRPVVAILATGDELVEPGSRPGADQIVSSNPVGVAALVREAGGEPRLLGIARDTREDLATKIQDGRDADVLVTIGGASVGDHDLVAPVLAAQGLELAFWKVAMRPGKPLLFGRMGGTRVMGLPGNPVSALISARVFLMPLVRTLAGRDPVSPDRAVARLTAGLEDNGPRLHLVRGRTGKGPDGQLTVTPAGSQDSSLLSVLADADCLIIREAGAPALGPGGLVEIERL